MAYLGNSPGVASQRVVTTFTATAGQTVFTPQSGYTLGYCDVFLNGIKLVNGDDYTASNGTSFTLASGAAVGDSVECVAYFPRGLSDGYLKAEADAKYVAKAGDTMTGGLALGGLLNTGATGQIKFPATQNASTDANTLDDYEEGTFTPTWNGGSISVVDAKYIKIGALVTLNIDLTFGSSAVGTDTTLSLPFPMTASWGSGSMNYTTATSSLASIIPNLAQGYLAGNGALTFRTGVANGNYTAAQLAGCRFILTCMYYAS